MKVWKNFVLRRGKRNIKKYEDKQVQSEKCTDIYYLSHALENVYYRRQRLYELMEGAPRKPFVCSNPLFCLPCEDFKLYSEKMIQKFDIGTTPALIIATSLGQKTYVELLLKSGEYVDAKSSRGQTALQEASKNGDTEVASILIDNGAVVNQRNYHGVTALMLASYWGHHRMVKLLVRSGAEINLVDEDLESALTCAVHNNNILCVEELVARGADVDLVNKENESLVNIATKNGYLELLELLLSVGASIRKEVTCAQLMLNNCTPAQELLFKEVHKIRSLTCLAAKAVRKLANRKKLTNKIPEGLRFLAGCLED